MDEIITLDGVRVIPKTSEVNEKITHNIDTSIQTVIQPSELGDSLKELNQDDLESDTRMSGIDMRSRLHYLEVPSVLALDSLVSLGVLPVKCLTFTRQKKRLSVSIDGKGRQEIVDIVQSKRDQDVKSLKGLGDRFKNFMGMNKK